jgi:tRNA threonylcarbamoyladenosine biosynthesis protein TsaB
MNLLAIETSTPFCSVALGRGEDLFARHFEAGQRHAELALDAVDGVLREAGLELAQLSGLAYGEGPGSFTGLRIACGLVQGIALARSLPVMGVGTLEALAEETGGERVIACLDARMGEVYHAAYCRAGEIWNEASAPGVYRPEAVPLLEGAGWIGCGSGFSAFGEVLSGRYGGRLADVRPQASPSATAVLRLARARFERGEGRDAASAVPIYLRDKVAMKTHERAKLRTGGRG